MWLSVIWNLNIRPSTCTKRLLELTYFRLIKFQKVVKVIWRTNHLRKWKSPIGFPNGLSFRNYNDRQILLWSNELADLSLIKFGPTRRIDISPARGWVRQYRKGNMPFCITQTCLLVSGHGFFNKLPVEQWHLIDVVHGKSYPMVTTRLTDCALTQFMFSKLYFAAYRIK